eukprot:12661344-Alexandrium_andersonii.AAC.1
MSSGHAILSWAAPEGPRPTAEGLQRFQALQAASNRFQQLRSVSSMFLRSVAGGATAPQTPRKARPTPAAQFRARAR